MVKQKIMSYHTKAYWTRSRQGGERKFALKMQPRNHEGTSEACFRPLDLISFRSFWRIFSNPYGFLPWKYRFFALKLGFPCSQGGRPPLHVIKACSAVQKQLAKNSQSNAMTLLNPKTLSKCWVLNLQSTIDCSSLKNNQMGGTGEAVKHIPFSPWCTGLHWSH